MPTIAIALLLASEALLLSPIKSRASNVCMLAKRQKASDLKKILQAAGVSTAGIVEKEELERLVRDSANNQLPPTS